MTSREARFQSDLLSLLPALRVFANLITRNAQEADDLVQATIVRALVAQQRFELGTNMKAWLFRILRNLYVSEVRHRQVRMVAMIEDTPEHLLQSSEAQIHAIELRELRRALKKLTPDHREILVLVPMAGFTYEEAAAICGCAVGTIKSRLNRAKASLLSTMSGDAHTHAGSRELAGTVALLRGGPVK